jgi:hypothetical protein
LAVRPQRDVVEPRIAGLGRAGIEIDAQEAIAVGRLAEPPRLDRACRPAIALIAQPPGQEGAFVGEFVDDEAHDRG